MEIQTKERKMSYQRAYWKDFSDESWELLGLTER